SWEKIISGGPGANFGWPYFEGGNDGVLIPAPVYRDFPSAAEFYAAVANGSVVITPALEAFSHDSAAPGYQIQAITGGSAILEGGAFPDSLQDSYLFSDFTSNRIFAINLNDSSVNYLFSSSSGPTAPIDYVVGPDGNAYYVDLVTNQIGRLDIVQVTSG
ncbi:hypothetical protein, partial [Roseicella aquatilis]|uniref:hypothetical protein n=1 Tax=Roseicella aquatilis TaxID=2527868 RepID=UPI00198170C9